MTLSGRPGVIETLQTGFKLVSVSRALEETQQLEVEKALVLANQGSAMWRQEKANKYTRGQVVSEDLSQNVVAVCGVVLPRTSPRQTDQVLYRRTDRWM